MSILKELLDLENAGGLNPASPVIHRKSELSFTFEVAEVYHDTEVISVTLDPATPTPGQSVHAVIRVRCITDPSLGHQWDLVDKTIEMYDHTGAFVASGTLVYVSPDPAPNHAYGSIDFTAPTVPGTYTWKVVFPEQSPHQYSEKIVI